MARVRFPQLGISKISKTSKRCRIPKVICLVVKYNIHNIPSGNINGKFCWDDFFVLYRERTFLQKQFFFSWISCALLCRIIVWPKKIFVLDQKNSCLPFLFLQRNKNGRKLAKSFSALHPRNNMWYDCDF